MALSAVPLPTTINGLNHIPPPPVKDFEAEFGGLLPKGKSITSSWGVTRVYDFAPTSSSTSRVLLIHGGGTPALGMAPLAHRLTKAGNHVVTYDLWGHGNSSTPLTAHTPPIMHSQIFEVLSHLGWTKAHFIGFSMGGFILTSFAATHPHMLESATILAGAGLWKRPSGFESFKIDGGWGREWLSRRTIMEYIEGEPPIRDGWKERLANGIVDTEPVQKWERENHAGHAASLVSLWRYGSVYEQYEAYKKVANGDVKVLVILGEKDPVIEAEATKQELVKLGWKGRIEVVPDATHEIPRVHSNEVTELVSKFWASL